MSILLILASLILLAVLIFYCGYLLETLANRKPGRVLYVGSNVKEQGRVVADLIEKYVGTEKTAAYALVEPGAGMATMASYLAGRFAWQSVEAVEIGWFILTLGRLLQAFHPGTKVSLIRADIFKYRFPKPAVVYCYLFPALLDRLYAEGRLEGRLVISLTFALSEKKPTEEIELRGWQKRLYVYDFR